jgi:hypothetical protein
MICVLFFNQFFNGPTKSAAQVNCDNQIYYTVFIFLFFIFFKGFKGLYSCKTSLTCIFYLM